MKVVKFNASFPFESRRITEDEWKKLGINQPTLVWDKSNNWMVLVGDVSEAAMPYILGDSGLSIIELDEEESMEEG